MFFLVMDSTTAAGYSAEYVANQIVHSVVAAEPELILAKWDAKIAIFLRAFLPNIYFWIMEKRAMKNK